jgi:hypothetical protein
MLIVMPSTLWIFNTQWDRRGQKGGGVSRRSDYKDVYIYTLYIVPNVTYSAMLLKDVSTFVSGFTAPLGHARTRNVRRS